MKVYIQTVDTLTGIHQSGLINEPVQTGKEVENALLHFTSDNIDWLMEGSNNTITYKIGLVRNTQKYVQIICIS